MLSSLMHHVEENSEAVICSYCLNHSNISFRQFLRLPGLDSEKVFVKVCYVCVSLGIFIVRVSHCWDRKKALIEPQGYFN